MNTNEKETTGKSGLSLEEKVDLILEKLDQLLKEKGDSKAVANEGPKDPPPTPPNP